MKRCHYNFLLILNCIISLFAGILIYTLFKRGTYFNNLIQHFISLPFYMVNTMVGKAILIWGCDFLWAYSLNFALALILKPFNRTILLSSLLAFSAGFLFEILQYFGIFSGTYDFFDILSEAAAVIVSGLMINKLKRMMKK